MIRLPVGELFEEEREGPLLRLACSPADRGPIESWLDRIQRSGGEHLQLPITIRREPNGLVVRYAPTAHPGTPFTATLREWGNEPSKVIPLTIATARLLLDLAVRLASEGFGDSLIAPASLRVYPGESDPLRLIPVPTRGATVAGWSRSDADAWHWLSPETVLGSAGMDPIRVLGVSLHHGLTRDLFPKTCTRRDRFARLLQNRVGLPDALRDVARAALPKSREKEAALLAELILDCLELPLARRFAKDEALSRFAELERKLSGPRLLKEWGYEDFRKLIDQDPEPPPPEVPADVPQLGMSWEDQAKRRRDQGDLTGALDAAWNAVQFEGMIHARLYLEIAQRIAATWPEPARALEAVDRLTQALGDRLPEAESLRVAYLKARYSDEAAVEALLANRSFESRWNEGVADLMRARRMLKEARAYNHVSRLCKMGRALFEAMPEGGGPAGVYARAYLFLLDGIAHVGAVASYGDEAFYIDSFRCFSQALTLIAGRDRELSEAIFRWLRILAQFTRISKRDDLAAISTGIEAMLSAQPSFAHRPPSGEVPEIPWFSESMIFPL